MYFHKAHTRENIPEYGIHVMMRRERKEQYPNFLENYLCGTTNNQVWKKIPGFGTSKYEAISSAFQAV